MPSLADPAVVSIYGSTPKVPPDEGAAIYLQPSVGCPHPTCTFCALHKDTFRARTREEFQDHLDRVRQTLGTRALSRPRIFFGDANALHLRPDELSERIGQALEAFPYRPVHATADARLHAEVDPDSFDALSAAGLRRVTIGLETAHFPLYRALNKPGRFDDLAPSLRRVKQARVGLGLAVLLGLGGRAFRQRHVADTLDFLRAQPLRSPDVVYFLRYRAAPVSPYAAAALADPDLRATNEEFRIQERAFREHLEGFLLARGVRLLSGELKPVTLD